ncbi:hypothetical protein GCM10022205_06900 [Spinactinospora alkalitolerans]
MFLGLVQCQSQRASTTGGSAATAAPGQRQCRRTDHCRDRKGPIMVVPHGDPSPAHRVSRLVPLIRANLRFTPEEPVPMFCCAPGQTAAVAE